jgi:hypothetical protein
MQQGAQYPAFLQNRLLARFDLSHSLNGISILHGDSLVENSMDILPPYSIIAHDRFGNRIVQEFVNRWLISGCQ